ncbi:MAG: hypothetical protein U0Q12_02860 [Vicinamibacterales bacterium]
MSRAFTWGFLRAVVNAFHPAPVTRPLARNSRGGLVADQTFTFIGQSSVKLPAFTLKKRAIGQHLLPLALHTRVAVLRPDGFRRDDAEMPPGFLLAAYWK